MPLDQYPTTAKIRNALGESVNQVGALAFSSLVNKWSKYKPIRQAGLGPNWPANVDGKYGLNLPTDWSYLQPRGITNEPGRMGDFRGYEHSKVNAFPTIQCRDTDQALNSILYPAGSPYTQNWKIRAFNSDSNDRLILPSALGLQNYYVGLHLVIGGVNYYKTYYQVKDIPNNASYSMDISAELVGSWGSLHYSNFCTVGSDPVSGTCYWDIFISVNATTGAGGWQNTLSGTKLPFPTDTDGTNTFVTSGQFDVAEWMYFDNQYAFTEWYHDQSLVYGTGEGYIYSSFGHWHLHSKPSWIDFHVYADSGKGTILNTPSTWNSGHYLVFHANSDNTGAKRQEDIILSDPTDTDHIKTITCVQTGSGSGGGETPSTITVNIYVAGGENGWSLNGTYTLGTGYSTYNYISISFMPVDFSGINANILATVTGAQSATKSTYGKDNKLTSTTITLPTTISGGETYNVALSRV